MQEYEIEALSVRVQSLLVKNFRLLTSADLALEAETTVIVGRNNTGKTSLAEIFRRFAGADTPSFRLEDFSLLSHGDFVKAALAHKAGKPDDEVRPLVPQIELYVSVQYDDSATDLGTLSDFIVDLDPATTTALIGLRYCLRSGAIASLFAGLEITPDDETAATKFLASLRERIPAKFTTIVEAIDPHDTSNRRPLEHAHVRRLLLCNFVNAQRRLDEVTSSDRDVLGRVLEALFKSAGSTTASPAEQEAVEVLRAAARGLQDSIDLSFNQQLTDKLLPSLEIFGYPGLGDTKLHTETTIDVERLLGNHTRVRYSTGGHVSLPEAYNGLGSRNLIFILLRLVEFFRAFRDEPSSPGLHLVFIEEPEAHLHPQMTQVFIRQLSVVANRLSTDAGVAWPVQFVVSTHSSHLANDAPFSAIRYFRKSPVDNRPGLWRTHVKDLRVGLNGVPDQDIKFLHEYLTLTRWDLFFADKAIIIEGVCERLLMPKLLAKVAPGEPNAGLSLHSQYVAVAEVGGAHAAKFIPLLKFLEVRTLIITDADWVQQEGGAGSWKKCRCHTALRTSNSTLKTWFTSAVTRAELLSKSDDEKVQDGIRIAYQIPEFEGGACGRSLEDSFILANLALFNLDEAELTRDQLEQRAYELAQDVDKSEFALHYAIESTSWLPPRYIHEGLTWLRRSNDSPVAAPEPEAHADVLDAPGDDVNDAAG